MLGVLPLGEDPDLSGTAGTAVPQHQPPCIGFNLTLILSENSIATPGKVAESGRSQ